MTVMDAGMGIKSQTTHASDEPTIRSLLAKHVCPVPYHEVRTRFLGNIATPQLVISPIQMVRDLWGGELPVFDSVDEVNKLFDILIKGLWNELTRHQKRSQPFKLTRLPLEPSAENLEPFGRVRQQELDGFVEGLFAGATELDLPERAHVALRRLSELRAMMAGIGDLVARGVAPKSLAELATTFKELRNSNRIMETEINEALLSCTRARRQMLPSIPIDRPRLN